MFTQQELQILFKFCDMATRQGGLEAASFAVPLSQKIQTFLHQTQPSLQMPSQTPVQTPNSQE